MIRFEYQVVSVALGHYDEAAAVRLTVLLTQQAAEGWQLKQVLPKGYSSDQALVIFKRPAG